MYVWSEKSTPADSTDFVYIWGGRHSLEKVTWKIILVASYCNASELNLNGQVLSGPDFAAINVTCTHLGSNTIGKYKNWNQNQTFYAAWNQNRNKKNPRMEHHCLPGPKTAPQPYCHKPNTATCSWQVFSSQGVYTSWQFNASNLSTSSQKDQPHYV